MLRVALQAGIVDVFHLWLAFQPLCDAQRAVAVALHAQGQGADAAQRQEAAERIENAADRVLQETELLRQRRVIPTAATPATTSEWPLRYLVAECTTTSKPRSSGRCRYGEAKVLSATLIS